jgi:hypothetical protein
MQVIAQLKLMNAKHHYWYALTDKPATRELYTTTSVTFWKNATTYVNIYDQFQGSSYDAILSLCDIRSKTIGDCRGAINACIWNGAAVANGKAKFDAVHKDLLKMSSPDTHPSPSLKIHLMPAVDKDVKTLIPGDWVFMKNHNYQDVIKAENDFQGRGWLNHSSQYHWSGENYLMVGESPTGEILYEGLGSGPLTEADARSFMTDAYNEAFVNLWMNGATLKNGTLVTKLTEEAAKRKIIFLRSSMFRITP